MYTPHTSRGQIVIAFVGMIMALVLFLLLIVNVSTLSRERIRLQTAADASALAMATFQARALNAIADRNFILKYPSGDQKKQHGRPDLAEGFSTPGIDQVADGIYIFPSKSQVFDDKVGYLTVIAPYQRQQDKFLELYSKLIPQIGETYITKNDSKARKDEFTIESFDIKREQITLLYYDLLSGDFREKANLLIIDGWMTGGIDYMYSFSQVKKKVELWGETFNYKTTAMGAVIPLTGKLWPEPHPQYKSYLTQTEEDDEVLH